MKIVQTTEKYHPKWNRYFSSSNTHGECISYNIDEIVFILFTTSSGFFFQFESCIIYCFHVQFVFFFFNVLIVVYTPRAHLTEVKLTFNGFLLYSNHYFVVDSIHWFYFFNNVVVCKALLLKGNGGRLVCKIFVTKIVSMHLSATWQFLPFQRSWATSSGKAY